MARVGWLAAARLVEQATHTQAGQATTCKRGQNAQAGLVKWCIQGRMTTRSECGGGTSRVNRKCSTHCDVLASVPSNDTKLNSQPDPVSGPGMSIAALGSTSSSVMFRTADIPCGLTSSICCSSHVEEQNRVEHSSERGFNSSLLLSQCKLSDSKSKSKGKGKSHAKEHMVQGAGTSAIVKDANKITKEKNVQVSLWSMDCSTRTVRGQRFGSSRSVRPSSAKR